MSGDANDPRARRTAEQDLLAEIGDLTSLVAAQERAIAESFDEMRRAHASLGWRAQRRFEKIGGRLLRNPLLREPYRFVRRAFEIWVDHGGTPSDPSDDTEISFEQVKGSTGRTDDFCEVVVPALS